MTGLIDEITTPAGPAAAPARTLGRLLMVDPPGVVVEAEAVHRDHGGRGGARASSQLEALDLDLAGLALADR